MNRRSFLKNHGALSLGLGIGAGLWSGSAVQAQSGAALPESVQQAKEVMLFIQETFYDRRSGLFRRGKETRDPDYLWGSGVMFSALVAGARHDAAWKPVLRRFFSALDGYWDSKAKPQGYEPAPTKGNGNDKYYDDNAWMVLTFLDAFELTGESRYLKRAEETLDFVLSGWDDAADGGIWWHEKHKDDAKNTCVNAPAAVGCFRLAKFTPGKAAARIEFGKKIVAWTEKKLRAANGLYADRISVSSGQLHDGQLTYNAGLMQRAFLNLHAITLEQQYLDEALRIGNAADGLLGDTGAYRDAIKWAHLMVEADFELYRRTSDERWLKRARANCAHHFSEWKKAQPSDLMANASLARELWLLADHETPAGKAFWAKSDKFAKAALKK